jgi:hypothetical protein
MNLLMYEFFSNETCSGIVPGKGVEAIKSGPLEHRGRPADGSYLQRSNPHPVIAFLKVPNM